MNLLKYFAYFNGAWIIHDHILQNRYIDLLAKTVLDFKQLHSNPRSVTKDSGLLFC